MKFNKAAACLVATACTASVFGAITSVSAAGDLAIKAETKTVEPGSTFTVDILLENVPSTGVAGLDFAIKYDSSVVKVKDVTEGTASKTTDKQVEGFTSNLATNVTDSAVSVLWATGQISTNASWIKTDGVLLTLNCEAVKEGTSKFEITKGTRKDAASVDAVVADLKVINPTVSAGTVTVKSGASADPTVAPTATVKPTSANTEGETLLGDVNCDGKVDITDISVLALAIVDKKTDSMTAQQQKNADVNNDGSVALTDLATIKQYISKQIDKLG